MGCKRTHTDVPRYKHARDNKKASSAQACAGDHKQRSGTGWGSAEWSLCVYIYIYSRQTPLTLISHRDTLCVSLVGVLVETMLQTLLRIECDQVRPAAWRMSGRKYKQYYAPVRRVIFITNRCTCDIRAKKGQSSTRVRGTHIRCSYPIPCTILPVHNQK